MKKNSIQILLVDDHQVVRDGLQRMLEQEEDLEVVGQSTNSEETLSRIEELSPDIVLMDIKMPGTDGIELAKQVKRRHPSCNIIMLTLYDQYLTQAMEAGARGYLLKDIKRRELAQAIRQVHCGQVVTSDSLKPTILADSQERRGRLPADVAAGTNDVRSQGFSQIFRHVRDEQVLASESFESTVKADCQDDQRKTDFSEALVDEIQVVLPPPVEASQLMRLAARIEESLHSRVRKMVGAWQEGTVMTVGLYVALPLADILKALDNMPEIEAAGEGPMTVTVNQALLDQAGAIPRPNNGTRKTIFLSLAKKQKEGIG